MTAVPAQAETIYPSVHRPWKQYFPEEIFQETLPEKSMYDFMHDLNKDYPHDIALEYLDIRVTYGELFQRIDETARALIGLGVQPGDIVTIAQHTGIRVSGLRRQPGGSGDEQCPPAAGSRGDGRIPQ